MTGASGTGSTGGAPASRGFAALVPLRRIFAAEQRDALLLIGTSVFLVGFGTVMVLSASSVEGEAVGDPFGRAVRQAAIAVVGIPLMLLAGRMPITFWKRWAWPAVLVAAGLQLLIFVPGLGVGDYNTNWLEIGGITFQPSELTKLALIVWMASVWAPRQDVIGQPRQLLMPVLPVAGAAIALVLGGNDLGTATIMLLIVFATAFFANARVVHLFMGVLVVALGVAVVAVASPSRVARITSWIEGCTEADYTLFCWQPQNGLYALANGGVLGVGLGNSRAKWSWLPEADSDYIFAIIGEELGLIGGIVVLVLFTLLAITLVRIMRHATDPFARIVTGGVLVWIVGQAFVNIAVVLGLLPVLGVPLPFISSGGSSLIAGLLAIGVVLSFTRARQE